MTGDARLRLEEHASHGLSEQHNDDIMSALARIDALEDSVRKINGWLQKYSEGISADPDADALHVIGEITEAGAPIGVRGEFHSCSAAVWHALTWSAADGQRYRVQTVTTDVVFDTTQTWDRCMCRVPGAPADGRLTVCSLSGGHAGPCL